MAKRSLARAVHPLPVQLRDAVAPDDLHRLHVLGDEARARQGRFPGVHRKGRRRHEVGASPVRTWRGAGAVAVGQHSAHALFDVHLRRDRLEAVPLQALQEAMAPGLDGGPRRRGEVYRRPARLEATDRLVQSPDVLPAPLVEEGEVHEHSPRTVCRQCLQYLGVAFIGHRIRFPELGQVFLEEEHHRGVGLAVPLVDVLHDSVDDRLRPGVEVERDAMKQEESAAHDREDDELGGHPEPRAGAQPDDLGGVGG